MNILLTANTRVNVEAGTVVKVSGAEAQRLIMLGFAKEVVERVVEVETADVKVEKSASVPKKSAPKKK